LRRELVAHVESWGYQQIRTPLIEYYELLGRGLDAVESERCIRFMEPESGKLVALRSDVTPQVAHLVAQRVGGSVRADDQIRLCYAAVTLAVPSHNMDGAERHQIGVELIGETAPHGDAELIALADEILCASGLDSHRIDLGETNIVRTALGRLPEALRGDVRELMSRKDFAGLVDALDDDAVDPKLAAAVAGLSQLYGDPQRTLERARETLAVLEVDAELDRLAAVISALEGIRAETVARLELDLGEARGHEYYTGFRLRVWAPGPGEPIVRGGRYDDLLGKYGATMPASGLAVDLDALSLALEAAGVPRKEVVKPGCLFALAADADEPALRRELAGLARAKRAEGLRAWVELCADPTHAEDRAKRTGASEFIWRNADGPSVAYRATSDGGFERVASNTESSK
jgi:ATP phosphoribosyltransferase regulatory subunit